MRHSHDSPTSSQDFLDVPFEIEQGKFFLKYRSKSIHFQPLSSNVWNILEFNSSLRGTDHNHNHNHNHNHKPT